MHMWCIYVCIYVCMWVVRLTTRTQLGGSKYIYRQPRIRTHTNTQHQQIPYTSGIEQASCGLYGKTNVGFVPMLPILKRVALLPFDPTLEAETEVMKEV